MIGDAASPPSASLDAVSDAVSTVGMTDEEKQARLNEEAAVRAFFKQFDEDQKFDEPIRKQIRKDRTYASGEAVRGWAVSTNLIGANIDTTVSKLYARDPDVSAKPAPQVDPPPDPVTGLIPPQPERQRNQDISRSVQLVLSRLWKKGRLKPRMRRVMRSVLSASHGWLKVLPVTNRRPDPMAQNEYNTLQENLASVIAQQAAIDAGQTLAGAQASHEDLQVQRQNLETSMASLSNRLEVEYCYGFTFDFVKPENLQVGTDVELLEEYLDSDSLTEIMYFPYDQLRQKFPELSAEDLQTAEKYYRKPPKNMNFGDVNAAGDLTGAMASRMYPDETDTAELYTTTNQQEGSQAFGRVLEKWCKDDNHIRTAITGVKVWARKPYMPSWGSSRFYPYFYFSLNEVDDSRCPQSMSSRGAKLQDEFSSQRSNLREVRRRSIPGVIFDAAAMSDEEAQKLQGSTIAEFTAIRTTKPDQDFNKMFAGKPLPSIDMRLYDTQAVIVDLERTFGNQEAAQTKNVETTATEEEIKAAGVGERTSTWRDIIETTLTDMAQYCAEVALQKIPADIAQKIAGPAVLWPVGMSLEDITSLFEVEIAAGTTGKPRNMGDREAWANLLPVLLQLQGEIYQLKQNPLTAPLATAKEETLRETLRRYGDETDLSRFIPQLPTMQPALPGTFPGAPGALPGEDPAAGGLGLGAETGAPAFGEPAPPDAPMEPTAQGVMSNGFAPPVA